MHVDYRYTVVVRCGLPACADCKDFQTKEPRAISITFRCWATKIIRASIRCSHNINFGHRAVPTRISIS